MSENKKIYRIKVQHVAPKDEHTSIECFLLAENDEAVYHWVDKEKKWDGWSERDEDGRIFDIYDDDYEVIGTETFKEKMIRIKGDLHDDNQDWSDAYYGLTFYGWELADENPSPVLIDSLRNMKVLFEAEQDDNSDTIDENRVDVEDVIKHSELRSKWNAPDLSELVFYKGGLKVDIPSKEIEEFKFKGLSNIDFVKFRNWD